MTDAGIPYKAANCPLPYHHSARRGYQPAALPQRPILTAPMAIRLAKAFGATPGFWLGIQMQRDLWEARRTRTTGIKRLVA